MKSIKLTMTFTPDISDHERFSPECLRDIARQMEGNGVSISTHQSDALNKISTLAVEPDGVIMEMHMEGDVRVIDKFKLIGISLVGYHGDLSADFVPKPSSEQS